MPVLGRWDSERDVLSMGKGVPTRYDPTSSSSEFLGIGSPSSLKLRSDGDASSSGGSADEDVASSSEESGEPGKRGRVDLTLHRLHAMHSVASNLKNDKSLYGINGRSKQRVKRALRSPPCPCQCRMPFRTLVQVCAAFWLLTKAAQDTILWSIQREHQEDAKKHDWFIEGPLLSLVWEII